MKYLSPGFYTLGFLLLLISGFMTFSSQVVTVDEDPGFASVPLSGFKSALWILFVFVTVILTIIAQNMKTMASKAWYFVVLTVSCLLLIYVAFVSSFSWGGPVHPSLENGATVGFIGFLIIVMTGILFIPSHLQSRKLNFSQTLLLLGVYVLLICCAFLPFEKWDFFDQSGMKNGIDSQLFYNYWIFGLALLVLGFRSTLFSKIITYVIIGCSFYGYLKFSQPYGDLMKYHFLIGGYIATISYLCIVAYSIYSIHKKR